MPLYVLPQPHRKTTAAKPAFVGSPLWYLCGEYEMVDNPLPAPQRKKRNSFTQARPNALIEKLEGGGMEEAQVRGRSRAGTAKREYAQAGGKVTDYRKDAEDARADGVAPSGRSTASSKSTSSSAMMRPSADASVREIK